MPFSSLQNESACPEENNNKFQSIVFDIGLENKLFRSQESLKNGMFVESFIPPHWAAWIQMKRKWIKWDEELKAKYTGGIWTHFTRSRKPEASLFALCEAMSVDPFKTRDGNGWIWVGLYFHVSLYII